MFEPEELKEVKRFHMNELVILYVCICSMYKVGHFVFPTSKKLVFATNKKSRQFVFLYLQQAKDLTIWSTFRCSRAEIVLILVLSIKVVMKSRVGWGWVWCTWLWCSLFRHFSGAPQHRSQQVHWADSFERSRWQIWIPQERSMSEMTVLRKHRLEGLRIQSLRQTSPEFWRTRWEGRWRRRSRSAPSLHTQQSLRRHQGAFSWESKFYEHCNLFSNLLQYEVEGHWKASDENQEEGHCRDRCAQNLIDKTNSAWIHWYKPSRASASICPSREPGGWRQPQEHICSKSTRWGRQRCGEETHNR